MVRSEGVIGNVHQLTPRQRECLRLVFQRRTTKEIAAELSLSPNTVSSYCTEAIALLGATDRRHAAELLNAAEKGDPLEQWSPSARVDATHDATPPVPPPGQPAHPLGPLAPSNRDADNDASITARLAWILILAIGLAVGFGSIVSSTRAISDVVRDGRAAAREQNDR
jgi:DNA-binding CsgD family transcriptional regulator